VAELVETVEKLAALDGGLAPLWRTLALSGKEGRGESTLW
jgi:hypothetical protein